MRIECAWCNALMGERQGEGTTHGICRSCFGRLMTDMRDLTTFEESLLESTFPSVIVFVHADLELHITYAENLTLVQPTEGKPWAFDCIMPANAVLSYYLHSIRE